MGCVWGNDLPNAWLSRLSAPLLENIWHAMDGTQQAASSTELQPVFFMSAGTRPDRFGAPRRKYKISGRP